MKINPISNTSFKSYVPVRIYARDQYNPNFHRVYNNPDNNYFSRCQKQIVRNLNGTVKEPNEDFIKFYRETDKDYASVPAVRSFYTGGSGVYLVTGRDTDSITINAKPIGKAKAESIELTGSSESNYTKAVVRDYYEESNRYLKHFSSMLKNKKNQPLTLKVYFDAVRDRKGKVKKFTIVGARFEAIEN